MTRQSLSELGNRLRRTVSLRSVLARGALLGLFLAVLVELGRMLVGGNFHVVLPGQVYRSAQPSAATIRRLVQKYDIRTVINLRGDFEPVEDYEAELRCARDLRIQHMDVGLWSCSIPTAAEASRLIDALDSAAPPLLLHCHSGSDRTGLASAIFLLLHTDASLPQARMQMSLRYGHFPFGRARVLDQFLDRYEDWLASTGQTHSADRLRWWVRNEYRPNEGG